MAELQNENKKTGLRARLAFFKTLKHAEGEQFLASAC